jgi:enamine deaminase RidA (YjgF/YER057c/UK114 family)
VSARQELRVPGRPELSHAADAVRAGSYVFVAGILPVDAAGELVGDGDTTAQARFVFGELESILAAAGCSAADVVKVTIFLTDEDDRPLVNPERKEVFGSTRPASTLVEVSALAVAGAMIEVDAIAAVTT